MSLSVPPELLKKAQQGPVPDGEFIDCIRESLPYAWAMVERLAKELDASGAPSVQNTEVPPDDASWGEMFRLVGSDAMRAAVERRFGVRLAFQNCCRLGLFRPDADTAYQEFISNELPNNEFFGDQVREKLIYYPTVTREPFRNQGRLTAYDLKSP